MAPGHADLPALVERGGWMPPNFPTLVGPELGLSHPPIARAAADDAAAAEPSQGVAWPRAANMTTSSKALRQYECRVPTTLASSVCRTLPSSIRTSLSDRAIKLQSARSTDRQAAPRLGPRATAGSLRSGDSELGSVWGERELPHESLNRFHVPLRDARHVAVAVPCRPDTPAEPRDGHVHAREPRESHGAT